MNLNSIKISIHTGQIQKESLVLEQKFFKPGSEKNELDLSRQETELGFPDGTIRLLNEAFIRQIPKNCVWRTISDEDYKSHFEGALCFANQIYKRGPVTSQPTRPNRYDILLQQPATVLQPDSDAYYVVDRGFADLWPNFLSKIDPKKKFMFKPSEKDKSLENCAKILAKWQGQSHWIIVGGGICLDTAGFCASLKGCSFDYFPTTLLSMIDVSVGGKTGVNYAPYGKNQVGLFAFPTQVRIHTEFLKTLPQEHWLGGLAEATKHALIKCDIQLSNKIKLISNQTTRDLSLDVLSQIIQVKAKIIEQDPFEMNVRKQLNLGHTFAHALEKSTDYHIPHGIAVGIGLLFNLFLSQKLELINAGAFKEIHQTLKNNPSIFSSKELQSIIPELDEKDPAFQTNIIENMKQDKKNHSAEKFSFILFRQESQRYTLQEHHISKDIVQRHLKVFFNFYHDEGEAK